MNAASLAISVLSLCVAATTAWLTLWRRGRLAMTQPAVVFFGFDETPKITAKVFLRSLLYSTAARGQVVERMFAKVHRGASSQDFTFWGYGETNRLVPGSGLYVGQQGVSLNHHFVLSVTQSSYEFEAGNYRIEVFARIVGRSAYSRLAEVRLLLSDELAMGLSRREGVLFEADPSGEYVGHLRDRPAAPEDPFKH